MEIKNETIEIINSILKNEIGYTVEELNEKTLAEQNDIFLRNYNPSKTIKHFKIGEIVKLSDGKYTFAGMEVRIARKKMNQEFEKILTKTK